VSAKSVLRRRSARIDIDSAADYYDREAGTDVALRFVDAVEAAFRSIADRPGAASSIWGERLKIAGLRSRPVTRFPYLVFYMEHEEHVEVWRVLHARSDIPTHLAEPLAEPGE
jgi:toxin ParE1/3/4